ncbi:methyltransferase-like protein 27 [Haliotis rufescens]|uniref:methyltransferase-like protein 27 n=1 Tax=Haliotis rufescens TaxID=6454 RepID=UPI00201EBE33|nr:methyltransferase-like protein 27 [Haliotis rufescens]
MAEEDREEAYRIVQYLMGDDDTSREDIIDRFSQHSHHYDKVLEEANFRSPSLTALKTAELFPSDRKNIYILDVAAGTGLCADKLYSNGFLKMDALEPSHKMLDEARKKGRYGRYFTDVLGVNALNIQTDIYDVVTMSALSTVVLKKMPLNAFEELIRIVKPGKYSTTTSVCHILGGYIINSTLYNLFPDDGDVRAVTFRENMKTLEFQGKWKQVELAVYPEAIFEEKGAISVHKVLK